MLSILSTPPTPQREKAGNRLYTHHVLDHEALFLAIRNVAGDFLMTYDLADDLVEMAKRHGFTTKTIAMKNTHHAIMNELLIGRNLEWVR